MRHGTGESGRMCYPTAEQVVILHVLMKRPTHFATYAKVWWCFTAAVKVVITSIVNITEQREIQP